MALLEIRALTKRFLGVTAVDAVSLAIERGERTRRPKKLSSWCCCRKTSRFSSTVSRGNTLTS